MSFGLKSAGIAIAAGVDIDPACEYPYKSNIGSTFINESVTAIDADRLAALWSSNSLRLLAGCAPCQPFSTHRRGADTTGEESWGLLDYFGRLAEDALPEFVTMENVSRLARLQIFEDFLSRLKRSGYHVEYGNLYGPDFGLPQSRRRLVLVASRIGHVKLPQGNIPPARYQTVRKAIGSLPELACGEADVNDPLHVARKLSELNLKRIRASKPGGTWQDWPEEIRLECHRRASGASFTAFYGRMSWDAPSPTITTQSFNPGTGRFAHPEQDRTITLREAAILQGFPPKYKFVEPGTRLSMQRVGRLIGNAVPPAFGKAVGEAILAAASEYAGTEPAIARGTDDRASVASIT